MRVVPINCVRPGTKLGKTIYNTTGNTLLKSGVELNKNLLDKLYENGVFTLYIDDGYSEQEIKDIIQPEVRNKAIASIRNVFELIERGNTSRAQDNHNISHQLMAKSMSKYLAALKGISVHLIETILSNKTLMINLVDIKTFNNQIYEHSLNVGVLALILAIEDRFNRHQLPSLFIGALLHDLGKMLIPSYSPVHPSLLTEQEQEDLKEHPLKGYEYIKENRGLDGIVKSVVLQHHEHYDGTGYPRGTSGEFINKAARIISIANVYDNLTSDTYGSRALPANEAMEYIMSEAGLSLDFHLVEIFVRKIIPYPPGTLIKLSNNRIAVVEEVPHDYPLRPKIRYVEPKTGIVQPEIIDLLKEYNIIIKGVQLVDPRDL